MNLLSSPAGHLSNLSTVPSNETQGVHGVPLLPSAADSSGRLGLVRVINRTDTAGQVRIKAFDDTQWDYAPLVLSLGAGEAVQFDSNDLELGNPGTGLSGGTGPGQGDWRLELSSELDIEVLSYVRSWDGLLTSMHDVVPGEGDAVPRGELQPPQRFGAGEPSAADQPGEHGCAGDDLQSGTASVHLQAAKYR